MFAPRGARVVVTLAFTGAVAGLLPSCTGLPLPSPACGPCDNPGLCQEGPGTCDVAAGTCTYPFKPAGTTCRGAQGPCDEEEVCVGDAPDCPSDRFAGRDVACRAAADLCDDEERCDGTSPACPQDAYSPPTKTCRPVSGVCDAPERCDGTSPGCPADLPAPPSTVCRPAVGSCDLPETCAGFDCPVDVVKGTDAVCRAVVGSCDVEERCDGQGASCPRDLFLPAGGECRPVAGPCDVAESCTGLSGECPRDLFRSSRDSCREAQGDCDAPERCTGVSAECPDDRFHDGSVTCRRAAGPCDVAEVCPGDTRACPADQWASAGATCRPAQGGCDVAETCAGDTTTCPGDVVAQQGATCREAAGDCDVVEVCDGVLAACPVDAFRVAGELCGPSGGACDVEERCTGLAAACPLDAKRPSGEVCRPAEGACDVEERCDGRTDGCPGDAQAPGGTACREEACILGSHRSGRTCDGDGTCRPPTVTSCSPYACGTMTCQSSCVDDRGCTAGFSCLQGACVDRNSYADYWAGGDAGATGMGLLVLPGGARAVAAVHGRRLVVAVSPAGGGAWSVEVVDGPASWPVLAGTGGEDLHVAYEVQGTRQVVHARRSPGGWVRSDVGVGFRPSLALDPSGSPHVAYHAWVGFGSVNRHAFIREGLWEVEDVTAGGGMGCSCIGDPTATCSCGQEPGDPHLAFDDDGAAWVLFPRYGRYAGLESARRTASGWVFQDVEPTGFLEGSTSLVAGPHGSMTAGYAVLGDRLRVATSDRGPWAKSDSPVPTGGRVALALDSGGHRHACALVDGQLKHASDATGDWVLETVDSNTPNARLCAVTVTEEGEVHVAYHDGDRGNLRWATRSSGSWATETVIPAALYVGRVEAALDTSGHVHLAATRRSFAVPAAWLDCDVEYWTEASGYPSGESLTAGALNFAGVSLGLDGAGKAHLAYAHQDGATASGPRHLTNASGSWVDTQVAVQVDVGTCFSLAVHQGVPRVAYCAPGALRLAVLEGAAWSAADVESVTPHTPSLVVDGEGHSHVLYGAATRRFATDAGGAWDLVSLGSEGTGWMPNALALSTAGVLHAAFYASGVGTVYAHNAAGAWQLEPVVPTPSVSLNYVLGRGNGFALVVTEDEVPHLFTANSELELVHLWRTVDGWQARVLDRAGRSLGPVAAARSPGGAIHVAYLSEGAIYRLVVPR